MQFMSENIHKIKTVTIKRSPSLDGELVRVVISWDGGQKTIDCFGLPGDHVLVSDKGGTVDVSVDVDEP